METPARDPINYDNPLTDSFFNLQFISGGMCIFHSWSSIYVLYERCSRCGDYTQSWFLERPTLLNKSRCNYFKIITDLYILTLCFVSWIHSGRSPGGGGVTCIIFLPFHMDTLFYDCELSLISSLYLWLVYCTGILHSSLFGNYYKIFDWTKICLSKYHKHYLIRTWWQNSMIISIFYKNFSIIVLFYFQDGCMFVVKGGQRRTHYDQIW